MEIEIIEDKENVLLGRRELKFRVSHSGPTPRREEVRERLIALFNSSRDVLIVESLKPVFGVEQAVGYAKIYESPERLREIERDYVVLRNFPPASEEAKGAEEAGEAEVADEGSGE